MKIGLEIHIRPTGKYKLFSKSLNIDSTGSDKNTNIDLFDIAVPGVMPILNRNTVLKGIKLCILLKCHINRTFYFDRKHYNYPDLPLGYQITQFHKPLATNGLGNNRIRIKQVHLEIDAAKTLRESESGEIDYNRSGIPLLEVVTEPDFRNFKEVKQFLNNLQHGCRGYSIAHCDLSKGDLRFDLNISTENIPRQEIKNLNSFNSAKLCVEYMKGLTEEKESYTWDWDEHKAILNRSRKKEKFQEYFYLPEPDLPVFKIIKSLLINKRKEIILMYRKLHSLRIAINDQSLYEKALINSELMIINNNSYNSIQLKNIGRALAGSSSLKPEQIKEITKQKEFIIDRILNDYLKGKLSKFTSVETRIPNDAEGQSFLEDNQDLLTSLLKGNNKLIGPLIAEAKKRNYSIQGVKEKIENIIINNEG